MPMRNDWTFKFRPNRPAISRRVTFEDAESHFLAKLNDPNGDQQAARRELVLLYRTTKRTTDALYYAEEYLTHTTNLEARTEMYFFMGQAMEHANDFESATRFYLVAFELSPRNASYQYFIRNNIGFSLNQLHRFVDAESFLREAIDIDPDRANGHKNLGLSLEGQRRYAEAARSFIAAVQANASDSRALKHLEELAKRQRELYTEIPDLSYQINMCRQAVAFASNGRVN